MTSPWRSGLRSFGLGLVAAGCGGVLRLALYPVLGQFAPGLAFVPFVIGAAWLGGIAAGLTTTVAGYISARYIFGLASPLLGGPLSEGLRVVLFLICGLAISWLTDALRLSRVRAERERLQAASILSSVTDGLIGLNPEFRLTYLNSTAETFLGRSRGERLGETLRAKLRPAMQQRAPLSFEHWDQVSSRWLEVHAYPDQLGGLSVLLRDISERKRVEQSMAEANRALERSNAELQQFAYVAAHDLREPLRNLMSYSELIGRRYGDALGGEGRDLLNIAVQGARRMQHLVDDLLTYCQAVGHGGDEHTPAVDCDAVLSFVRGNFSPMLAECGGKIVWSALPGLRASESQVMQLFQNLIGNALKYRSQMPLLIQISAVPDGQHWVFSVQDNGIGIGLQHQDEIFGLFRRLHGQEIPGTGLGLAICKRIVEHYDGRIWVESQPGQGSTFYFSFPDSRVQEPLATPVQHSVAKSPG
jgi:signal transduction histidine kinase